MSICIRQKVSIYKTGSGPEYDVLKAKTDYENANLNLIESNNDVRVAKLQLENLLNEKFPDVYLSVAILKLKIIRLICRQQRNKQRK